MTIRALAIVAYRAAVKIKRMQMWLVGTVVLALTSGSLCAQTITTLNFDNIADDVAVTNQYASQGVVISGANAINAGLFGFSAHSGTQVAYAPGGLMTFSLSIANVKTVSAYITGPANIGIFAYDSSNNLLGQSLTSSNTMNALLSVTSSSIAISRVQIHNGGASFAVDDISFTTAASTSYSVAPLSLGKPLAGALSTGINSSGQVTGIGTTSGGARHAFAYLNTTIQDIGTLGGASSIGKAINGSGQIVGVSQTSRAKSHGFSWTQAGGMQDIGTLGGNDSDAVAVNNAGQVVGSAATRNGKQHAFLWSSGGILDLGTLGGKESFATAINNLGQIVGKAQNGAGQQRAFSWTPSSGMIDLGSLGGGTSAAIGVNSQGYVAGTTTMPNGKTHGFLWFDNVMHEINLPGTTSVIPTGVNDHSTVVGVAINASGQPRAFAWTLQSALPFVGNISDLGTLGGNGGKAAAVNGNGKVVGSSQNTAGIWRATLWSDGNAIDLNTKVQNPPAGLVLDAAIAVSDNGSIVATSNQGLMLLRPLP